MGFSTLILALMLPTVHFLLTWVVAANFILDLATVHLHCMFAFHQDGNFCGTLLIGNAFRASLFRAVTTCFEGEVNHFLTIIMSMRFSTEIWTRMKIAAHVGLAFVLTS